MWIDRKVEKLLLRMAESFPAVLVSGARQTGKTSLLRRLFPDASYLTLELPANAEAARTTPETLLARYPKPIIIDEIQYAPLLLRHLKAKIDEDRSPGRYLLTGSQIFSLMQGVSESLAGRVALLDLDTLSRDELIAAGRPADEAEYVFRGGYPELHAGADAELWFPAYVATYLERDVRNVLRVADLQDFNRFMRAAALRTAQMLNITDIARDTGVAPNTARKWLSLVSASGVVFLLEPYFGNRQKRVIKAPKLLFRDTGLAAFLCGFRSAEELFRSNHAGAFFETHVIGQVLRLHIARGVRPPVFYWRTAAGREVDLVVEVSPGALVAVEAKWKEHPTLDDAAGLRALAAAEPERVRERVIAARPATPYRLADGTWVVRSEDLDGILSGANSPR